MRKLTVDDIVDHRAYERERDEFRAAHHRGEATPPRRHSATSSPSCSRTPTRCASRCRRWHAPSACSATTPIAHEVATYNELIPDAGELSGTLFIELIDDAALRAMAPSSRRHRVRRALRARRRLAGRRPYRRTKSA